MTQSTAPPLAPWLQSQLSHLIQQQGHAWLLQGPSGLGHFDLAMALAKSWLCEKMTEDGACGLCASCRAVELRTHADLSVLMPETHMMELDWPLPEKAQKDIDEKVRKPSKDIRVESARQMVAFSHTTRSSGTTKVVLVYPAERMNLITANTILKTLEEPPGEIRFLLVSESFQSLLPTLRSRCQTHTLEWPSQGQALSWLSTYGLETEEAKVFWMASGGRPDDALALFRLNVKTTQWLNLPQSMALGDVRAMDGFSPSHAISVLQKICHDALACTLGGTPRFFPVASLPLGLQASFLTKWSRELSLSARSSDHPYNPGLMLEALVAQASHALTKQA